MADLSCAIDSTADNTLQIGPNGKFYVPPPADSDDQLISLAGNILTLEDGGAVNLSAFLDDTDTDDQTITQFTLSPAGVLTLEIQDGNTVTVDLSSLSTVDTDDQTLSLAGTLLSIADGNTVDLSAIADTDVSAVSASLAGSTLTVSVTEDGNTVSDTEDLAALDKESSYSGPDANGRYLLSSGNAQINFPVDTNASTNPFTPDVASKWSTVPTRVKGALDTLIDCCPDSTIIATSTAFANPESPLITEVTALAAGSRAGTQVVYESPSGAYWCWHLDRNLNAVISNLPYSNVCADSFEVLGGTGWDGLSSSFNSNGGVGGADTTLNVVSSVFTLTNPNPQKSLLIIQWKWNRILAQVQDGAAGSIFVDVYLNGAILPTKRTSIPTSHNGTPGNITCYLGHGGETSHCYEMAAGESVDLQFGYFWTWGSPEAPQNNNRTVTGVGLTNYTVSTQIVRG